MSRLSTHNEQSPKPFNPKIHKGKRRGQDRKYYYDRDKQHSRNRETEIGLESHFTVENLSVDMILGEETIELKIYVRGNNSFDRSRIRPRNRQFSGNVKRD